MMTKEQIKALQELGFQIGDEVHCGVSVFSDIIPELNVLKSLILIMTFPYLFLTRENIREKYEIK